MSHGQVARRFKTTLESRPTSGRFVRRETWDRAARASAQNSASPARSPFEHGVFDSDDAKLARMEPSFITVGEYRINPAYVSYIVVRAENLGDVLQANNRRGLRFILWAYKNLSG